MNKKALIREYVKSQKYFTLSEAVKKSGLGEQVVKNYLQALKAEKIVFSAGRGLYSSMDKEFSCHEISRVAKVRQMLKKGFPLLDFIIWDTSCFQGYYHHMQTHHITFVEVEQDAVQSVADRISRSYRYISVDKRSRTFNPDFDITKDPIIVCKLISRSPRNGHSPRLEKMLVDLFVIKDKYRTMPEADYWELWRGIYSLYRINFAEVINYAVRRRNLRVLITQIIDNVGVSNVIYGSKSELLPQVTRKKSGCK